MCGISGVLPLTDIPKEKLFKITEALLLGNRTRGGDATGIVNWEKSLPDQMDIYKSNTPANEFLTNINPDNTNGFILCHNRAQTRGDASDKENNHPMFGKKFVIVHNGMISMKKIDGYVYKGQCDTEDLLSYIETKGIEQAIPEIDGSACIALFNIEEKSFHLFKHNNPLYIACIPNVLFAFSSTKNSLEEVPKVLGMENIMNIFSPQLLKEMEEGDYIKIDLKTKQLESKKIAVPYKYQRWNK